MKSILLGALACLPLHASAQPDPSAASAPQAPSQSREVRERFVALHEKQDQAACIELWKAHPELTLPVIDADLEGSLAVREKAKSAELSKDDEQKIAKMHARALWGARAAQQTGQHALVLDYTSSFVGWNAEQRKAFRGGQAAYKEALGALDKKDGAAARKAGEQCLELAMPLGDWWGGAMGAEARARAEAALGDHDGALTSWALARMMSAGLCLQGDELGALVGMLDACEKLGLTERARASAEQALVLSRQLGADDTTKTLEARLAALK